MRAVRALGGASHRHPPSYVCLAPLPRKKRRIFNSIFLSTDHYQKAKMEAESGGLECTALGQVGTPRAQRNILTLQHPSVFVVCFHHQVHFVEHAELRCDALILS